jgi:hypothetical protein
MKRAVGAVEGEVVAGGKGKGSGKDQLNCPNGVVVDAAGNYIGCDRDFAWAVVFVSIDRVEQITSVDVTESRVILRSPPHDCVQHHQACHREQVDVHLLQKDVHDTVVRRMRVGSFKYLGRGL